jgi:hypothetical protein
MRNYQDFYGRDLVSDERSWLLCLKLGPVHLKYNKVQNFFLVVATNIYFELFVAACIIFNTIVMAISYDGQPDAITYLQTYTNYAVFAVFVVEAVVKIIGMGRLYFLDAANWFDLLIILTSIIDFSLPNVPGLVVFRVFRLVIQHYNEFEYTNLALISYNFFKILKQLRIFKLAKTWKALGRMLKIIGSTLPAVTFITVVMSILLFCFAVLANGLFGTTYQDYYSQSTLPE